MLDVNARAAANARTQRPSNGPRDALRFTVTAGRLRALIVVPPQSRVNMLFVLLVGLLTIGLLSFSLGHLVVMALLVLSVIALGTATEQLVDGSHEAHKIG